MKYALKVPLLGLDEEWVFVSKSKDGIAVFDTREEAEQAAKIWKKVKVVDYREPGE